VTSGQPMRNDKREGVKKQITLSRKEKRKEINK
jgi:hypothetical protein